jgi:hypothetical protein
VNVPDGFLGCEFTMRETRVYIYTVLLSLSAAATGGQKSKKCGIYAPNALKDRCAVSGFFASRFALSQYFVRGCRNAKIHMIQRAAAFDKPEQPRKGFVSYWKEAIK